MKAVWIPLLLMNGSCGLGWGQSAPPPHFALTGSQVARVLSEGGVPTDDKAVSLPAAVVATQPDPTLDVIAIEKLGSAEPGEHQPIRSRVKLACRTAEECLPFFAIVTWPEGTAWAATIASGLAPAARTLPANSEVSMPAGAHATLVMDDQRSHIQVSVVSLENGIVGHKIRVASPDHKQFYVGEVVSSTLLKGSF
jgi:hypothetical protein